MDNKRTLTGMVVALGLLGLWLALRTYVNRLHPDWAAEYGRAQSQATTAPAPTKEPVTGSSVTARSGNPATTGSSTGPSLSASPANTGLRVVGNAPDTMGVALGSATAEDRVWSMQLKLMPGGAGVEQVTLNEFKKGIKDRSPYSFQTPYAEHPGTAVLATQFIEIDGNRLDLATVPWNLQSHDISTATYALSLATGPSDKPAVHLTKTYVLPQRNSPSKGYEVPVVYTIENLSERSLKIKTGINGPTIPPKEVERGADRQVLVGYNEGPSIRVAQHVAEEFHKDKISQDLSENKGEQFVWTGAGSVYFVSLVLPGSSSAGGAPVTYAINATALDPDNEDHNDILMQLNTGEMNLAAGQSAKLPLSVYFGPKKREVLEDKYYSALPRMYDRILIIGSSYCGVCTFTWLVNTLVIMLSFFHKIFHDWGLAIIALVLVVRLCLHPITKRSQVYMVKMGKMGPEMERLKLKYADDKDALNKAMMQFYKEQGMAPVLGCLPMFLQMPIWIALWTALQSTFELRLSPFLQFGRIHLTWISDLARPDALVSFSTITLPFGFTISALNLLPILLAVVFFMQQKYTPKPVAATPEQAQQQKMMTWMSTLLFPLFLYKGPAGLNLYIFASTAAGIWESKVVRDHIKQREEAEKAGRVFVETRPTRAARLKDKEPSASKQPAGKLVGWLAALQAKADEISKRDGKIK